MSQKQEVANAENTAGTHNESPHGGGRRRRPPPCGEGRPKAAPHYVVRQYFQHWPLLVFVTLATSCFFSIGLRLYFQLLPPPVFSAFAPYCIFSFRPRLFFQLLASTCIFSFCPLLYFWAAGPKNHILSASLYTLWQQGGQGSTA